MPNSHGDNDMNNAQLDMFRQIADAMRVPADRSWNWYGPFYVVTGLTKEEADIRVRLRGGKIKHNSEIQKPGTSPR